MDDYGTWAVITGCIVFVIVWLYALAMWGFLIGLLIGWLPALIAGFILGAIWPVPALAACGLVLMIAAAR